MRLWFECASCGFAFPVVLRTPGAPKLGECGRCRGSRWVERVEG